MKMNNEHLITYFIRHCNIESFLACGWTIAYHVIKWWTSYPRKPWIVDFGSRFFTACDDVIRE